MSAACTPSAPRPARRHVARYLAWAYRQAVLNQQSGKTDVEITPKQRAHLKSLAHHLKPVVFVGKEGITDQTVRSLEEAFNTRELLKVRILEAAPMGTREGTEALAARLDNAVAVQSIGRVGVIYRPHPDKPEIDLPE